MNNLVISNNIMTIISFVVNLAFVIPFLFSIKNYFSKKRYINKILEFSNTTTYITHSTFYFSNGIEHEHEYITYESLEGINNIIKLLHTVNKKFDLTENAINPQNEINIGGFVSNKKVNAYFTKHFPNFKFVASTERKSRYIKYPINQNLIEYSDKENGFLVGTDIFLKIDKTTDYAFVIKMKSGDFKNDNNKTIHIVFGGGNIGTVKATEYLLMYYKQIYKKYKTNHYFFALEINKIDNSINFSKGIIDLTDIMFKDNTQ